MSDTLSKTAASPSAAPPPDARRTLAIARLRDLALVPAIVAVAIVGYIIDPAITHGLGLHVLPPAFAIPVVLLVGVLVGAFNGLLIVRFGLNGFIVTLGALKEMVAPGLLAGAGATASTLLPRAGR